jgi:hypothetical protein
LEPAAGELEAAASAPYRHCAHEGVDESAPPECLAQRQLSLGQGTLRLLPAADGTWAVVHAQRGQARREVGGGLVTATKGLRGAAAKGQSHHRSQDFDQE